MNIHERMPEMITGVNVWDKYPPTGGGGLVDGAPVSSWADSSGNGHTATGTGSSRPIYKTSQVNGKPVVRFTSAAFSILNVAPSIPATGNMTFFVVGKRTGAQFVSIGGTENTVYGLLANAGNMYAGNNVGYLGIADATGGAFHVITSFINYPAWTAFYTNGAETPATLSVFPNTGVLQYIGALLFSPGYYTDGDIAEIIVYDNPLALRAKLVLLLTALITTGELPPQSELDAMAGHRHKIKQYLVQHGAHPTKAQLDAVVEPMAVGDRANIEKYLGTKYGITVAGGTAVDPSTVAGLVGWWKADSLL